VQVWLEEYELGQRKPRTLTVLTTLAGVALLVSWIWAYALTNALIGAEVIPPWPADYDPRLQWMLRSFLGMTAGLIVLAGVVRFLSSRQLRKIDAMAEG
jgi:hypothetical protein